MKLKLLLLLSIPLCFQFGYAQTSQRLSSERNYYRSGDKLVMQQVEYKDPGSKGKELSWDFSSLQSIDEEYHRDYFRPDSLDHPELFCGLEHETRYYYKQQQDSVWATGFENSTTLMSYIQPELRIKYPFSYGDTLFSMFEGNGEYCHAIKLHVKGFSRSIADASGTLILPDKTIKNALRVRTIRNYIETGKDSVEMTLDCYAWYSDGIRYPVFESVRTTLSKKGDKKDEVGESLKDTTVYTTSYYYPPDMQEYQLDQIQVADNNNAGTDEIHKVFTEGRYLPNPVVTDLQIEYKLTRGANVWFTLHNNVGVPQSSTSPEKLTEGYHSISINMSNLMTGTYMLYVHVDDMVMKQIIIKQ